MTDSTRPQPTQDDERWVANQLQHIDRDLPEFPESMLERAAACFDDDPAAQPDSETSPSATPSRPWPTMIFRVLLTAAAATLLVVLLQPTSPAVGVSLGSVLDEAQDARTLQLKVLRDGETADVYVANRRLRWQESPSQYQITAGSRWWRVDEEQNTVESGKNPWYRSDSQSVDLLALLGLSERDAAEFRRVTGSPTDHQGRACHVFRIQTLIGNRQTQVEAYADAASGELLTIAAWPPGARQGAPLAELQLVARDIPVDEELFVVARTLSQDGRVGKVVDFQGMATLRPLASDRWTVVSKQMLVKPGDWLRTSVRGAHAMTVGATSGHQVIVGPGSVVEWLDEERVRLHRGEARIVGPKKKSKKDKDAEPPRSAPVLELLGPQGRSARVASGETRHLRIQNDDWIEVAAKPRWLAAFEGTSTTDPLGSLICNVDGESTSLSIGFHRVKVEIRDQIARTTIEESFVNRTDNTLEGIFHFPLPQDASISGFGMWINDELIEADVVEKQRAREIYETILRERRDPALLEWTGGNVFKARIFPIPAHQEKRIRIVYTQVLPMRAQQFRYSYGLKSELLQQSPLRELSLSVLVHSELPIKDIACRTHACRVQKTEHSAKLEFVAEDYTPTRDFEVRCEVDPSNSDVVVVPHQRGDDGYFLVQFTPPTGEGNWQRELLPDGDPLRVLLVCDTSGSMDQQGRRRQREFITAVLDSLGEKDRFNLAVADVDCTWLFESLVKPTDANRGKALDVLHNRVSLGWTDLDRALDSVDSQLEALSRKNADGEAPEGKPDGFTHVVYVGDGIVSARDADPQQFAARTRSANLEPSAAFHAVSVGNRFESSVLNALAAIGNGSVRQLSSEQTPQATALEWLNEIAQPAIRDLQVEFRGIRAAAVYPRRLPNLPAGVQQIIVGRYLPDGQDQEGEIIVSGMQRGKKVRYATRVKFEGAESGNSFIPRLWARAHLDELLAQGGPLVEDDVVALSEEFHIMTPYTSLLVLETDADRERFGVQRRFLMRDGERFFAEGRSQAQFELLQQQRKLAGDWRLGLRRKILQQFSTLGRNPQLFRQWQYRLQRYEAESASRSLYYWRGEQRGREFGDVGGGMDSIWLDSTLSTGGALRGAAQNKDRLSLSDWDERNFRGNFDGDKNWEEDAESTVKYVTDARKELFELDGLNERLVAGTGGSWSYYMADDGRRSFDGKPGGFGESWEGFRRIRRPEIQWPSYLFPVTPTPPVPAVDAAEDPIWPDDAVALSKSLLQPIELTNGDGILIEVDTQQFLPRWSQRSGQSSSYTLYSPERWLEAADVPGSDPRLQWCDGKLRGIYSLAFRLGRQRQATTTDLSEFHPGQRAYGVLPIHRNYASYEAKVEQAEAGIASLTLTHAESKSRVEVRVDTEKHVVLEIVRFQQDERTAKETYAGHQQVAGVWWPAKIENFDGKLRRTMTTAQKVVAMKVKPFEQRFRKEIPAPEHLLPEPLPNLRDAQIAEAKGAAAAADRLVLLMDASSRQDWDVAMSQLEAFEKQLGDSWGKQWVRAAVEVTARKQDDALRAYTQLAEQLADATRVGDWFLADYLLRQLSGIADANERLRVLEAVEKTRRRQPEFSPAQWRINQTRVSLLNSLSRNDEALAIQRADAMAYPWNVSLQVNYARALVNSGDVDAGEAWLRQELKRPERDVNERGSLRSELATLFRNHGQADKLVAIYEQWIEDGVKSSTTFLQYLNALTLDDQSAKAADLALRWMEQGREQDELEPVELAKTQAGYHYALGNRYSYNRQWIDPEFLAPLKATATHFIDNDKHFSIANEIVNHHRFRETDHRDAILDDLAKDIVRHAREATPYRVNSYVNWIVGNEQITAAQWEQVAANLKRRWLEAEEHRDRDQLNNALMNVYRRHDKERVLPFMRERIERARNEPEENERRQRVARWSQGLFNELLNRTWAAEYEAEAIRLLEQLGGEVWLSHQLGTEIYQLHQFVDRMIANRVAARSREFQDKEHPENFTRTQLAKKFAGFKEAARLGVVETLLEFEQEVKSDVLKNWVQAERFYLELRLGRKPQAVHQQCWTWLGKSPQAIEPLDQAINQPRNVTDQKSDARAVELIEQLLRQRALVMTEFMSVRRSAPKSWTPRLMEYIQRGVQLPDDQSIDWKQHRVGMLIVMDDVDQLETDLSRWIRGDDAPASWQVMLGQVLAEQGKFRDAIKIYEQVQRDSYLQASAQQALSQWYLVEGRRDAYDAARKARFEALPERQIQRWIEREYQPWNQHDKPLPTELDEDVLYAFEVLFSKSSQPGQYIYQLGQFYGASRDFRLLRVAPASLSGRTPQQVYSVLHSLDYLLRELRDEASSDELLQQLTSLRQTATSPLDRRAFDLLELQVERKAATLLNQPGPHIQAALAAMQRAFKHAWARGEPEQMAEFLKDLGELADPRLRRERMRQFAALAEMEPDLESRFRIRWSHSYTMYWRDDVKQPAIQQMEASIREMELELEGVWPQHLNDELSGFINMLINSRRFDTSESLLIKLQAKAPSAGQRNFFDRELDGVYLNALIHGGTVSLGAGRDLLHNAEKRLLKRTQSNADGERYQAVIALYRLYDAAHKIQDLKFQASTRARAFLFQELPDVLKRQKDNYANLVSQGAGTAQKLLGDTEALRFVVIQMEDYPARLEMSGNTAWRQHASQLGYYRELAGAKGEKLEPRMLALVLTELRRDLRTRYEQSRIIYRAHSSYFWYEKRADFARVAEQVLKEQPNSERNIAYVANYLFNDLGYTDRGIAILMDAHKQDRLGHSNQVILVDFLMEKKRYAEAIPILEPIVESHPHRMSYRTRLLRSFYHTKKMALHRQLLKTTDEHFRQEGRWQQSNIRSLAACCLETRQYKAAAGYFQELIDLVKRQSGQGSNSVLAADYISLASAYIGAGETKLAVDAASASIVTRGNDQNDHANAIEMMRRALAKSDNLQKFIDQHQQEVEKTGLDSPLLRRQIGSVLAEQNKHRQAIENYLVAIDLDPSDTKTRELLIKAYEHEENYAGMIEQTLAIIDFDRHTLEHFTNLVDRMKLAAEHGQADTADVERASTNIVEASPQEAEYHAKLATLREQQDRWEDAALHWKRVAELRRLEPRGLQELAEAQIKLKQWTAAKATLQKLQRTAWPSRFEGEVQNALKRMLPQVK